MYWVIDKVATHNTTSDKVLVPKHWKGEKVKEVMIELDNIEIKKINGLSAILQCPLRNLNFHTNGYHWTLNILDDEMLRRPEYLLCIDLMLDYYHIVREEHNHYDE